MTLRTANQWLNLRNSALKRTLHTGDARLAEVLSEPASTVRTRKKKPAVLLSGRCRKVALGATALQRRFPGLSIAGKTIHASRCIPRPTDQPVRRTPAASSRRCSAAKAMKLRTRG